MDITKDVLEVCLVTPSLKTSIMYRTNLSFRQLETYLRICVKGGLLKKQIDGSRVVYITTEKGVEFLEAYDKIMSLVKVRAQNKMVKKDES